MSNQDQLSFKVTPAEREMIDKIVKRAQAIAKTNGGKLDKLSTWMDLAATHANGNPMDFAKLLAADDFNLAHDVFGIARHLDRSTGQLTGFFSPRCSAREAAAAA